MIRQLARFAGGVGEGSRGNWIIPNVKDSTVVVESRRRTFPPRGGIARSFTRYNSAIRGITSVHRDVDFKEQNGIQASLVDLSKSAVALFLAFLPVRLAFFVSFVSFR